LVISVAHNARVTLAKSRPMLFLYCILSSLLCSFAFGVGIGLKLRTITEARHTLKLKTGQIAGTIVRSGERGLLFLNTKNSKLSLHRWDDVQEICSDQCAETQPEPYQNWH
jgi:hypothetical protein